MIEQNSFSNNEHAQALYLIPTPIGNLEDITYRAVRKLKEVHIIAAEDTRQTAKLLNHYDIHTPLFSYHEHNKKIAGPTLIKQLKQGKTVALVSDAGMPTISDPGEALVKAAINEQIRVIALPGANAALTSLIASGLPTSQFQFIGFLPRKKNEREAMLAELQHHKATLLFYESPHRLKATLLSLQKILGNRNICLGRELTKKFEQYVRGSMQEIVQWYERGGTIRGEFCIVVEGCTEKIKQSDWWDSLTESQHVSHYITIGMTSKEAIKQVAKDRHMPRREVYAHYHKTNKKNNKE